MDNNHYSFRSKLVVSAFFLVFLSGLSFWPGQNCQAADMTTVERNSRKLLDETNDAGAIEFKDRLEISVTYDRLSPRDSYGDWKTGSVAFYRKAQPDCTWFTEVDTFSRRAGNAQLGTVGVYKDWTPSLSTFTSIAAGTSTDYLPRLRIDQDFNFKLGQKGKFVWTIGGTTIKNFNDGQDNIISTGLISYMGDWTAEYRIFRNLSDPGSVTSYSRLISLAYGVDREQITTLSYSYGKQAYLATDLASPEAVSNDSKLVTLNYRHWLETDHGYFTQANYFNLQNAYHKIGLQIGMFREF